MEHGLQGAAIAHYLLAMTTLAEPQDKTVTEGRSGRAGALAAAIAARRGSPPREPRRRRFGPASFLALAMLVAGVFFAGGFLRFAQEVNDLSHPAGAGTADGIVVLTGGALRIDQAIDLLKTGHGKRLLISGVNPGTSAATLARMTGTSDEWFDCCVDLDYAALNTVGNAEIASRWAREKGFRDLILVTSDYHMPRSLREFDRQGDLEKVVPFAVRRDDLWQEDTIPTGTGLRILLTEYLKLVTGRLRSVVGIRDDGTAVRYAAFGE